MDKMTTGLNQYIEQVSNIGNQFGPLLVKAMILLVIVLILAKYLGQFLAHILVDRFGVPERKAVMSVTVLHLLVLLVTAQVALIMLGFPGMILFRILILIALVSLALLIIAKPYLPQLPFKTGDTIKFGTTVGKVEKITFMHTLIRTFDAKVVFVPNHKVLNDQVVNLAMNPNRRLDVNFFISYDEDLKKVREIIKEGLKEDPNVLDKPAPRVVIAHFSQSCREMQARFWVPRTKALTQRWLVNEMIDQRLAAAGISMAPPLLELVDHRRPAAGDQPAEEPAQEPEA